MKKIPKLKLTNLIKSELEVRKMNNLRGGAVCECGCKTTDLVSSATAKVDSHGATYYGVCSCSCQCTPPDYGDKNSIYQATHGIGTK